MNIIRLKDNQRGLTLVELLAVIVILGILFLIAVISLGGTKERAEADVCAANRLELEKQYGGHLALEGADHSVAVFSEWLTEFGSELCPVDGVITIRMGMLSVVCRVRTVIMKRVRGIMVGILFCEGPCFLFELNAKILAVYEFEALLVRFID